MGKSIPCCRDKLEYWVPVSSVPGVLFQIRQSASTGLIQLPWGGWFGHEQWGLGSFLSSYLGGAAGFVELILHHQVSSWDPDRARSDPSSNPQEGPTETENTDIIVTYYRDSEPQIDISMTTLVATILLTKSFLSGSPHWKPLCDLCYCTLLCFLHPICIISSPLLLGYYGWVSRAYLMSFPEFESLS
jgi:hypothetical protein